MKPSYSYGLFEGICNTAAASKFFGKSKAEIKNDIYNTVNALEKSGYIKSVAKDRGRKAEELLLHNSSGEEDAEEIQARSS